MLGIWGWGGLNIFFRGRKSHQVAVTEHGISSTSFDPEALQSGFRMNCLFWSGDFGKMEVEFLRASGPPQKITPKLHGQTCRHSSPISFTFSSPKSLHADFLLLRAD